MLRLVPLLLVSSFLFSTTLANAQNLSPEESVKHMKVPAGFEVKIVAAEPMVRQPVSISFDDQGRIWVVQYLQYPNPAGLKPVKVDQFLRTTYDRVPEPPPKGPKGADRITILSDFDENGRARKSKDFVTGLNLCSGMCLGHGGVFVLQAPYLLFYRSKDGETSDGDPEVLLKGFGLEDAHAVANSLQWGPDGWLYGAQGSTVTANIRGIEFQQGIWRYHPLTKEFELFSEGGGNTWGLDFDAHGNAIAGTNWGGVAMLHQVQGGYYVKGFAKHGPLHNAHTYGYIDHVPYKDFHGGHVTCGGIVYHGGAYPEKYTDQYIAANVLSNALHWHILERKGSTFTSRFGGEFLTTDDIRFRPVDCLTGPDGAVYVADWYDIRANHVDPVDNWDKTTGRIYKIVASEGQGAGIGKALGKLSSKELVALLAQPNDWYPREARRILAERRDSSVLPLLRKQILEEKGPLALESLWALYVSGGFDDELATKLFDHPNEDVRTWTVRLLGDRNRVKPEIQKQLVALARRESSATVRSQLACSSKKLPSRESVAILRELLRHEEDNGDQHIPLLLWWAIENYAIEDREAILSLLEKPDAWDEPLIRQHILERLARRYMAEGTNADYATCARLLEMAPGPESVRILVRGMEKALDGRILPRVPAALEKSLATLWTIDKPDTLLIRFALRLGNETGYARALDVVADTRSAEADRVNLIEVLGQTGKPACVPVLLSVLREGRSDALRGAALGALQASTDERIVPAVQEAYPNLSAGLRARAQSLLASRPSSSLVLLSMVDAGKIAPKDVPLDLLRGMAGYKDERLTKLLEKHWGKVGPLPAGEKTARINAIRHSLGQRPGDRVNGKALFTKTCASCHTLWDEGNKVGPELTGADRKNRDFLLTSLVDPSAYIRPEFVSYIASLKDGRSLTGLIVESSPQSVTLLNEKNERTVLARTKIEELSASAVSLMPEKLLDPLSEQEIRDLFSYLQGDGPLPK